MELGNRVHRKTDDPESLLNIIWYSSPILQGLNNLAVERLETLGDSALLAYWMGCGSAMAFFQSSFETGNTAGMESLKFFMEYVGRLIQRKEGINLGYGD